MMHKIITLLKGYAIHYEYDKFNGSIANTTNDKIELDVFEYNEATLITYLSHGIFIQIWIKSYDIKRIGSED